MKLGNVLELLRSSLPHSLAGTLHHHSGHLHQRSRILLVEELLGAEIVLVLDIYIIDLVPHLLVDSLWLHHIPAVGIGYDFGECASAAGSTLHLLLDIGWIEDGGSALDADSLLHLLHSHIAMVAIVGEISIRILTGYVADCEVHTSHKFIYVVETQGTPSVALSWLNYHISTGQRCLESSLANGLPVLLITVVGTHIVHIDLGNLTLLIPAVACGYHLLDTSAIVAVYATKHTIHTNLACLLWRHTLLYEHSFRFGNTGFHQVVILITLGICRHLYRLVDEEETGCCQVAELTGSLNYDIDARTAQLLGWDETQIGNTTEGISYRFYTEHIEKLVSEDPAIKGIWCVPKYSNPQGYTYSEETVKRFARLKPAAPDFRIYWDNAYSVHHLYDDEKEQDFLLEILDECAKAGNPDMVYKFTSTSKISFPGSGIAALAASKANLDDIRKYITVQTIGHDKLNQLRHVKFFKNLDGVHAHMSRHAAILRPKFEMVEATLEKELGGLGIGEWTTPKGGYFISFESMEGCAKKIVAMAKEAGVVMTGAGATYPYGKDPKDSNIRIAPSFPPIDELEKAAKVFVVCVKLASVEKLLAE